MSDYYFNGIIPIKIKGEEPMTTHKDKTCYNRCDACGYCNSDDEDFSWCEYYDSVIDFFKDTSKCEGYEAKEDDDE